MHHHTHRTATVRSLWQAAGAALIALALAAPAAFAETGAGSESPGTVSAVWVQKKINFTFQGFTTHYSCEGLESAVKSVLLQLGARKSDMKVHQTGCVRGLGRPEPFPGVAGTFWVLEPEAKASGSNPPEHGGNNGNAGATSAPSQPVKAEWQTVKVLVGRPGLDRSGQCELIDQVKHQILPLFTTRDVKFESDCVPHQLTIAGSRLQAQVLKVPGNGRELAQAPGGGKAE